MGDEDYISLTDIDARFEGEGRLIESWLKNQNTIEYLTVWETLHNPAFNSHHLAGIREQAGLNRFIFSVKKWVDLTGAVGSPSGRRRRAKFQHGAGPTWGSLSRSGETRTCSYLLFIFPDLVFVCLFSDFVICENQIEKLCLSKKSWLKKVWKIAWFLKMKHYHEITTKQMDGCSVV